MNGNQIFNSINNIQIIIKNHKEEIEKLDQEIGDGDHIFNILRGLDEILNLKEKKYQRKNIRMNSLRTQTYKQDFLIPPKKQL